MSSEGNFGARFSDVISRVNQWWHRVMSDFFQVNHGPIVGNFESSQVVFVNLRAYTSSPLVFRNPLFVTVF